MFRNSTLFLSLLACALANAGCSRSDQPAAPTNEASQVASAAGADRCSTIAGADFLGMNSVRAFFQGVDDGIESSIAARIDDRGGLRLNETFAIDDKCYVTAHLAGTDEGNSYDILYRCPIDTLTRGKDGAFRIRHVNSTLCETIDNTRQTIRKDVTKVPHVDYLFTHLDLEDPFADPPAVAPRPVPAAPAAPIGPVASTAQQRQPASLPKLTGPADVEPLATPASWITGDDYPSAALRNREQGRVKYLLRVNARGRVDGCEIVVSSGSKNLDEATCQAVSRHARFAPALDANGDPVDSTFSGGISWRLPG